jgi:hypothetical protein
VGHCRITCSDRIIRCIQQNIGSQPPFRLIFNHGIQLANISDKGYHSGRVRFGDAGWFHQPLGISYLIFCYSFWLLVGIFQATGENI